MTRARVTSRQLRRGAGRAPGTRLGRAPGAAPGRAAPPARGSGTCATGGGGRASPGAAARAGNFSRWLWLWGRRRLLLAARGAVTHGGGRGRAVPPRGLRRPERRSVPWTRIPRHSAARPCPAAGRTGPAALEGAGRKRDGGGPSR